jgi:NAD(P)H-hydrate epimerase
MIPHFKGNVPYVTVDQMKKVDDILTKEIGISLLQMMENAGLNLALLAKINFLENDAKNKKVIVLAGSGGNGGGAMVAARRLSNWGADVSILLSGNTSKLKKETKHQYSILKAMGVSEVSQIDKADLIIDGLIGYGIKGEVKSSQADIIESANKSGIPVLSLDAPSGIDLTTGNPSKSAIKATSTLTLGLPKFGLFKMRASRHIGDLYLADISIPPKVFKHVGIETDVLEKIFAESTIVKINKLVVLG